MWIALFCSLLQEILERTGYSLDVTTGQRKYGGPPPNWEGNQPGAGHEVSYGLRLICFQFSFHHCSFVISI